MSVYPHTKLLGIQRVSNPSTENQRISTPAHSNGYKWEMHVSSELMVQIKQKGIYGVENPLPRSFLGGYVYACTSNSWHIADDCSCISCVCVCVCVCGTSGVYVYTYHTCTHTHDVCKHVYEYIYIYTFASKWCPLLDSRSLISTVWVCGIYIHTLCVCMYVCVCVYTPWQANHGP